MYMFSSSFVLMGSKHFVNLFSYFLHEYNSYVTSLPKYQNPTTFSKDLHYLQCWIQVMWFPNAYFKGLVILALCTGLQGVWI
jgi:hypothetical protein